jgi:hypothetical protein
MMAALSLFLTPQKEERETHHTLDPKERKMPKERHEPLFQQLQKDSSVMASSLPKKKSKKKEKVEEEEQVDEKTSRKILKMVKEQQQEMNAAEPLEKKREWKPQQRDEEENDDDDIEEQVEYEEWNQGQDLLMDQNDDRLLEKFMNGKKKLNLSEMIMSKIDAANAGKRPLLR